VGVSVSASAGRPSKWLRRLAGVAAGTLLTVGVAFASEDCVQPPYYDWNHKGFYSSFDTASLRRGFEVYRQVCSTCHSMKYLHYRNLVGRIHTEEQAKALAKSISVKDGPNEKGEYFERPGKLSDHFPSPYENDEQARSVNGGALPPDLSLIVKARARGEDYIFALLTGYKDPPAGVKIREGLHYNPYFPGGAISMAQALNDGQVEYEDGTPATVSQMAKDVATFLTWASEPTTEERKRTGAQFVLFLVAATILSGYQKRFAWSLYKTRKIEYRDRPGGPTIRP